METKKRTHVDFSQHEVLVEELQGVTIHLIKRPHTITHSVRFINTSGILAVTGDFGNWIFCREFIPSAKDYVSDGYWEQKLRIASTQNPEEFDYERTQSRLEHMVNGGCAEYGYDGKQLEESVEYYKDCLQHLGSEDEYRAYVVDNLPRFMDYDNIILIRRTKFWLLAVFDAFDEICNRMRKEEADKATTIEKACNQLK